MKEWKKPKADKTIAWLPLVNPTPKIVRIFSFIVSIASPIIRVPSASNNKKLIQENEKKRIFFLFCKHPLLWLPLFLLCFFFWSAFIFCFFFFALGYLVRLDFSCFLNFSRFLRFCCFFASLDFWASIAFSLLLLFFLVFFSQKNIILIFHSTFWLLLFVSHT